MQQLSHQDLKDILIGATILGTGGGGGLSIGLELVEEALSKGNTFTLVDINDAPDDAFVCVPAYLGAVSQLPPEEELKYEKLPRLGYEAILLAYQKMQEHLGRSFYGTVACEMGGANTAVSFYAAAMNDQVILDADQAGRAVPEVSHSTLHFNDVHPGTIASANEFGESFMLTNVADAVRAEMVLRELAKVSRNDLAIVTNAQPLSDLKDALIPGTVSKALGIGAALRRARETGGDLAQTVARSVPGGFVAFRGTVQSNEWKTDAGFTLAHVVIKAPSGEIYEVQVKNENMLGRHNGSIHATIPDLICLLDTDTGEPVTNPNARKGQSVAVIILPAPEAFQTPRALQEFGPAYLGLEEEYCPARPI